MAWSTPLTAVANDLVTAADYNSSVRDNLLQTLPAKATAPLQLFRSDGAHSLAPVSLASKYSLETPVSISDSADFNTYVAIPDTALTVDTPSSCVVFFAAQVYHSNLNNALRAALRVDGASTVEPEDAYALQHDGHPPRAGVRRGIAQRFDNLTAGTNTFTMCLKSWEATGSIMDVEIVVVPL